MFRRAFLSLGVGSWVCSLFGIKLSESGSEAVRTTKYICKTLPLSSIDEKSQYVHWLRDNGKINPYRWVSISWKRLSDFNWEITETWERISEPHPYGKPIKG